MTASGGPSAQIQHTAPDSEPDSFSASVALVAFGASHSSHGCRPPVSDSGSTARARPPLNAVALVGCEPDVAVGAASGAASESSCERTERYNGSALSSPAEAAVVPVGAPSSIIEISTPLSGSSTSRHDVFRRMCFSYCEDVTETKNVELSRKSNLGRSAAAMVGSGSSSASSSVPTARRTPLGERSTKTSAMTRMRSTSAVAVRYGTRIWAAVTGAVPSSHSVSLTAASTPGTKMESIRRRTAARKSVI
mmetsp:Transcript_41255/g.68638  ORF Transcript_41255/g.68638 Transcript_41255/m.68638 type:complete len:250 (+) Transcript_41255:721-1470(+)